MISTRGRYALRVMIDLAEHYKDGYTPLKDVAARQEISKKYLEIIMKDLISSGMVEALSGKSGGYRLARQPDDYTVLEIIESAEGPLCPVACLKPDAEDCPRRGFCKTLPVWKEYYDLTRDFFERRLLSDFI